MTEIKENNIGLIPFSREEVKVGDKLYLRNEKRGYKVQARNDRYIIINKPHFKTVMYSILDLKEKRMGPDDYVFSLYSYETQKSCEEALQGIIDGKFEISQRRGCRLITPDKHIKSEK